MQPQYTPKLGKNQSPLYHHMTEHRLYGVWKGMKQRCSDPAFFAYDRYGGRGIEVCQEWRNNFMAFYHYATSLPGYDENAKLSLDRIDNNGNYEPGNVRWVTQQQQCRNKDNNRSLTFGGETMCLTEWAERIGMKRAALSNRLLRGWSVEEALTAPLGTRPKR